MPRGISKYLVLYFTELPKVQPFDSMGNCDLCPKGQFQDRSAQSECIRCDNRHYASEKGSSFCSSCPKFTESRYIGAEKITDCQCVRGYYGNPGEECKPCPEGAECEGATALPKPIQGYWRVTGTVDLFMKCFPKDACAGGAESLCGLGYKGDRCGECEENFFRRNDLCSGKTM